jgi:hypothetical protein
MSVTGLGGTAEPISRPQRALRCTHTRQSFVLARRLTIARWGFGGRANSKRSGDFLLLLFFFLLLILSRDPAAWVLVGLLARRRQQSECVARPHSLRAGVAGVEREQQLKTRKDKVAAKG